MPCCLCAIPQEDSTPVIDSLKHLIINAESEKEKVDVYNKIAFQFLFIDTLKAIAYIDTASTISKQIEYPQGLARAINILAIHHSFQNRHDKGIELNKTALSFCQEEDHFVKGKIQNGLGLSYQRIYVVDKSLEHYHQALIHSSKAKDTMTMSIVLGNIASVNATQKNKKEAEKYFRQLEKVASNYKNQNVQYTFHLRFSEFLTANGDYDESNKYLKKALKNAEKLGHNSKIRLVRVQTIINHVNSHNFELAEIQLKNLIDPKVKPNENTYIRYWYWNSQLEFQRKNYDKAIYFAHLGLDKINETNNYHFYKPRILQTLHQSENRRNNFKKAYIHLTELKSWQDSIDLKERGNKFIELESKYQSEKKEIENALLLEQSNSKTVQLKQRTILAIGSLLTLLLTLFLLYILYRNSKKEKSYNEILESKVAERTKKLQESNQELERFAYIASHDLKEPITTIRSFSKLLKLKINPSQSSKQVEQYIDIIEKSSNQMQFLVNGILDYSKLRKGENKEQVDLNETLENVKIYLHQIIANNNAQIISNNLPTIQCNSIQVFQVFKNLIENGIKYNQSSKCVIEIDFEDHSDYIFLTFKDNGIGIDLKYKDRIFEMFSRLKNQSEYSGSGMGLSIVKKITSLMGGSVSLVKSDSSGTTFVVKIPKDHSA